MKRALVLLVLFACSAKSNGLPAEAWGVSDYASAGLEVDKPWAAADFIHATSVLEQATAEHRDRLPRFRSAKSGAVFSKLIADLPDDSGQPIDQRFSAHAQRFEATNKISKLYMENALAPPNREWIELMGALLREARLLTTLSDTFIASFGPDDPKREARLQGLAKMQSGYGSMLLGGLLVAGDGRVSEVDRVALVQHVTAALPTLFPVAPDEAQRNIRDQVAKLVDGLPAGDLRNAVTTAQHALPQ